MSDLKIGGEQGKVRAEGAPRADGWKESSHAHSMRQLSPLPTSLWTTACQEGRKKKILMFFPLLSQRRMLSCYKSYIQNPVGIFAYSRPGHIM